MYKLKNITEIDGSIAILNHGAAIIDCSLGNSLEFKLEVITAADAYHITMIEATIDGVMARFNNGTAQVSTPHGLVNFITQQLPVFNFDEITINTLTYASKAAWRVPENAHRAINELIS